MTAEFNKALESPPYKHCNLFVVSLCDLNIYYIRWELIHTKKPVCAQNIEIHLKCSSDHNKR